MSIVPGSCDHRPNTPGSVAAVPGQHPALQRRCRQRRRLVPAIRGSRRSTGMAGCNIPCVPIVATPDVGHSTLGGWFQLPVVPVVAPRWADCSIPPRRSTLWPPSQHQLSPSPALALAISSTSGRCTQHTDIWSSPSHHGCLPSLALAATACSTRASRWVIVVAQVAGVSSVGSRQLAAVAKTWVPGHARRIYHSAVHCPPPPIAYADLDQVRCRVLAPRFGARRVRVKRMREKKNREMEREEDARRRLVALAGGDQPGPRPTPRI